MATTAASHTEIHIYMKTYIYVFIGNVLSIVYLYKKK